jgi:hypothetical protein
MFVYQHFHFVYYNSHISCDRKIFYETFCRNLNMKQCRITPENIVFRLETDEVAEYGWSLHDEMLRDFIVHSNLRMFT